MEVQRFWCTFLSWIYVSWTCPLEEKQDHEDLVKRTICKDFSPVSLTHKPQVPVRHSVSKNKVDNHPEEWHLKLTFGFHIYTWNTCTCTHICTPTCIFTHTTQMYIYMHAHTFFQLSYLSSPAGRIWFNSIDFHNSGGQNHWVQTRVLLYLFHLQKLHPFSHGSLFSFHN